METAHVDCRPTEVRFNPLLRLAARPVPRPWRERLARRLTGREVGPESRVPFREAAAEVFREVMPTALDYLTLERVTERCLMIYDALDARGAASSEVAAFPPRVRAMMHAAALAFMVREFSRRAFGDHHFVGEAEIDLGGVGVSPEELDGLFDGPAAEEAMEHAREYGSVRVADLWEKMCAVTEDIYGGCWAVLSRAGLKDKDIDDEIYDAFLSMFDIRDEETGEPVRRPMDFGEEGDAYGYVCSGFQS